MFLSKLLNLVVCSQEVFSALCNLDSVLQTSREKKETLAGPVLPQVPSPVIWTLHCVFSPYIFWKRDFTGLGLVKILVLSF